MTDNQQRRLSVGIIYKITNTISGKSYIGQTIQPLKKRYSQHWEQSRAGAKGRLYDAFRKYPKEVFEVAALCSVLDHKDLDHFEEYFVSEYNSYKKGYNQTRGGYQGGYVPTMEAREKISRAMKGRENTWAGKAVQTRRANGDTFECRTVNFEIIGPDGQKITGNNLTKYCRENGLNVSNMWETYYGRRKHNKGYKLISTFID